MTIIKGIIKKTNYLLPPLLWMGVIFTFSGYQTPGVSEFYWVDFAIKKTIHVLEYGFLWLLLYRALKNTTKLKTPALVIWALVITALYGMSDEWHQTFTPTRTGRLRDVTFDSLGAVIAGLVVLKWLPRAPQGLRRVINAWGI
jgi:hypothetical protein